MGRTVFGWAGAAAALACLLGMPPSVAAHAELRRVRVLLDQQGGSGRAVELEFSRPIEMSASRFYIRAWGAREFVRAVALPRQAASPTRVFLVVSPDAGSVLEIRWYVRCTDGHRQRGERSVRLEDRPVLVQRRDS
jgi:methionine-rich copper-binding protein CopC